MNFSAMSEAELQELGLNSIVTAGNLDSNNPMIDAIGAPLQSTDKAGRQIVSYKQYQELSKIGARLDNYAIRMVYPGKNTINTIQASKYLKWYGLGYRPLGMLDDVVKKRTITRSVDNVLPEDVQLYFCREKYPDCTRVFDREKGLTSHWKLEHGEAPIKRGRPRKLPLATDEVEDDEEEE